MWWVWKGVSVEKKMLCLVMMAVVQQMMKLPVVVEEEQIQSQVEWRSLKAQEASTKAPRPELVVLFRSPGELRRAPGWEVRTVLAERQLRSLRMYIG
jgi:hypothetical protein